MNKKNFLSAQILLPKTNFEKWAVVACDQYTSDKAYWEDVAAIAGTSPSTLNVILPECYLSADNSERIAAVNGCMRQYIDSGVFNSFDDSMIYVERSCSNGKMRRGIVGLIDLEDYDYSRGATSLIRATEQTVVERIPPRVKIRKDAPLELPHILLLVDDPQKSVIEPLAAKKQSFEAAYDFDLMKNGGHISGNFIDKHTQEQVNAALDKLIEGREDKLLFAVGDGNHSLATAKECYKLNKTEASRYALVEVVNIHDESIEFEPIYRVLFNCDPQKVLNDMRSHFGGEIEGFGAQRFEVVSGSFNQTVSVKATAKLPVGTLQKWLDSYLAENSEIKIDYIHGQQTVYDLCERDNTVGFIFDGMKKSELFDAIRLDGSLPRKTFSMGHANDKRYYIEARKI